MWVVSVASSEAWAMLASAESGVASVSRMPPELLSPVAGGTGGAAGGGTEGGGGVGRPVGVACAISAEGGGGVGCGGASITVLGRGAAARGAGGAHDALAVGSRSRLLRAARTRTGSPAPAEGWQPRPRGDARRWWQLHGNAHRHDASNEGLGEGAEGAGALPQDVLENAKQSWEE
jgi:hypothetical protein